MQDCKIDVLIQGLIGSSNGWIKDPHLVCWWWIVSEASPKNILLNFYHLNRWMLSPSDRMCNHNPTHHYSLMDFHLNLYNIHLNFYNSTIWACCNCDQQMWTSMLPIDSHSILVSWILCFDPTVNEDGKIIRFPTVAPMSSPFIIASQTFFKSSILICGCSLYLTYLNIAHSMHV